MNPAPAETQLARISALIESRLGLHFPPARWNDLEQGLTRAAAEFGLADGAALMEWLLHDRLSRRDIELLASQLTIGETYFFRERAAFDALESRFFPELTRRRHENGRRLRLWCAGCCTGEEPYSLAMLLERLLPDIDDWNTLILATDINPQFLQRAAAGLYKEWSFRESGPAIKERFFRRASERQHEVLPRIRRRVTFEYLNLAEDIYPSLLNNTNAMDLILCRNVLMYFSAPRMKEVVGRLYRCLAPGGCLVVSATETSQQLFAQFHAVPVGDAVLYVKEDGTGSSRAAVHGTDRRPGTAEAEPASLVPLRPRPVRTPQAGPATRAEPQRPVAVREAEDVPRALDLYRRGSYDEAEAMTQRLMQQAATAELLLLRARIAANRGSLPTALDWCDRALAAERLDPRAHYLRAVILQELDRPLDAVTALHHALYLDPEFVLAHFALGHLALRQQRLIQARKHFANALELLCGLPPAEELPESDGLTAGRLAEVIASMNMELQRPGRARP